jgi:hypothetical protein
MAVDVKSVTNRRRVRFNNMQDMLNDMDQLASGPVRTLGNRSFVEILRHLARVMNGSIDYDASKIRFPLHIRILARLFRKRIFATRLPAGRTLRPEEDAVVWPAGGDVMSAIEEVRKAVRRLETESKRGAHPAFGKLSVEEWNQFHLRHAELHLSFVTPA